MLTSRLVACSPVFPDSQDTGSFASSGARTACRYTMSLRYRCFMCPLFCSCSFKLSPSQFNLTTTSLLALSCLSQLHMLLLSLFSPSMYLM